MRANYQTYPINPFVFKPLMLLESTRDNESAWRQILSYYGISVNRGFDSEVVV
jgi:hypothetical protein